jgi:hypothetical protein
MGREANAIQAEWVGPLETSCWEGTSLVIVGANRTQAVSIDTTWRVGGRFACSLRNKICLFGSQRRQRVDARSPARRKHAGHDSDQRKRDRGSGEDDGVVRRDAIEQLRQQARHERRQHNPEQHAGDRDLEPLTDDQAEHRKSLRAQCDADARSRASAGPPSARGA